MNNDDMVNTFITNRGMYIKRYFQRLRDVIKDEIFHFKYHIKTDTPMGIYYDSFMDITIEIKGLRDFIYDKDVPENFKTYKNDVINCCNNIIKEYDILMNSNFTNFDELCKLINHFINIQTYLDEILQKIRNFI